MSEDVFINEKIKHLNFYPEKYKTDNLLEIRHNYLPEQFENSTEILNLIRKVVEIGDFTLGQSVDEFEENFAKKIGLNQK